MTEADEIADSIRASLPSNPATFNEALIIVKRTCPEAGDTMQSNIAESLLD